MKNKTDQNIHKLWKRPVVVLSVFIITFVITINLILGCIVIIEPEFRSAFGDMFGFSNAIFSGLAFAGIIITILLQKEELEAQREEISLTREEFKTQNETLKIQRFENTFFHLIELHQSIISGIVENNEKTKTHVASKIDNSGVLIGRKHFEYTFEVLYRRIKDTSTHTLHEKITSIFDVFHSFYGHYFRTLYRIIKLVDETDFNSNKKMTEDEHFKLKYRYTSIVRAQLSNYEALWLYYNCLLSGKGKERFKPLVEKYSLLKTMPKNLLPENKSISEFNPKAFDPNA